MDNILEVAGTFKKWLVATLGMIGRVMAANKGDIQREREAPELIMDII